MTFAKIGEVEIRPSKTLGGAPGLAAFVGGRFIGSVVTDPDGAVLVRVARCKKAEPVDLSGLVEDLSRDIRKYEERLRDQSRREP